MEGPPRSTWPTTSLILQTGKLPSEGGDVSEATHREVPSRFNHMEPTDPIGKWTRRKAVTQPASQTRWVQQAPDSPELRL